MATSRVAARERAEQDLAADNPAAPLPRVGVSFLERKSPWEQGTARAPGRSLRSAYAASLLLVVGLAQRVAVLRTCR